MQYAGFWKRVAAGFIDSLIFIPIIAINFWTRSLSWEFAVLGAIPIAILYLFYYIYFHARWGQTIGKMIFHIKIVLLDGSAITLRESFLRCCVELAFSILTSVIWTMVILSISKTTFESLPLFEGFKLVNDSMPTWGAWTNNLYTIWALIAFIVLLFNKKKRAIQDFIAGTVVIRLKPAKERANNETQ